MLSNRHKEKLAELTAAPNQTLTTSIFGSYVGTLTKSNKHHLDMVLTMLERYPYLEETKSFTNLIAGGWIPGRVAGQSLPAEPSRMGTLPGTNTLIARNEDHDNVDPNTPPTVSVAKKLVQLYKSARKRGIDFDLSHEDVGELLNATHCYFTGVEMTTTGVTQRTVDRLDNKKGYVAGNVVACTYQVNQLKNFLFEDPQSEIAMSPELVLKFLYTLKHGG